MYFEQPGGSKIIVGEGYQCYLPKIPPKEFILFSNQPREEQYWRRTPLPQYYIERVIEEEYKQSRELELVLTKQKKAVTYVDPVLERYRRQEWMRRRYGIWFMNDGEPVYLTGHHYFYLQWSKFDHDWNDGYPAFYEFSRDNFYIRQWCQQNPKSLGHIMIASRGTGKSNEEIARICNRATFFHRHRAAIQSKSGPDAKEKILQAKVVPLFNNLPKFFKPQFSQGTDAKSELTFSRPSVRGSGGRDVEFDDDQELKSVIFAADPGPPVLDGDTLKDAYASEVGKLNPRKIGSAKVRHNTNLKTVFRNQRKIGIDAEESTVEEMDEGGDECEEIYIESDPTILDGNGFTKSKIHRHFISALDTDTSVNPFKINGKDYDAPCNKYGKVDRSLSALKIQADLDAVKDDLKEVSSRMRKSPRNPTEAFIKDQSKSIFNIQLLSNRYEFLTNRTAKKPYVRGNLYWLKEKFGPVGFTPDEHAGRFNWAWFPDEFSGNPDPSKWKILNNFRKEMGYNRNGRSKLLVYAGNNHLFRIGTDPIKFTETDDPRASKAAAHGFRLFDYHTDGGLPKEKWKSHNFIFEYIKRPNDPEIYFEDMAMACMFLGCKMLPERNVDTLNGYFKYNGLDWLMWYPKDDIIEEAEDGETLSVQQNSNEAGYAQTKEVTNYYTIRIMQFINEHINRMPFDETIKSWMNFDPKKPTKYDASVSSGMTLVHAEKKAEIERPSEGEAGWGDWFDQFDNSGEVGTFVDTQQNK